MTFRYARHTNNLKALETFYTEIVGLEKLGGFENHSSYDGVFLGKAKENWHLEFTSSTEEPIHQFDEDDALVFYLDHLEDFENLQQRLKRYSIELLIPKNPYWRENGIQISDPDGANIIFTLKKI